MFDEQIRPTRPFYLGTRACIRNNRVSDNGVNGKQKATATAHRALMITLAARLTALLEKLDLHPLLTALARLNQRERLLLAQNIAMLNHQHRSIMPALPRFFYTIELDMDGRKLQSINIQDACNDYAVRTFWF